MDILREFISETVISLNEIRLSAQNRGDLEQAVNWLRLNDQLGSAGEYSRGANNKHTIKLRIKGDAGAARSSVSSRFGSFVDVA